MARAEAGDKRAPCPGLRARRAATRWARTARLRVGLNGPAIFPAPLVGLIPAVHLLDAGLFALRQLGTPVERAAHGEDQFVDADDAVRVGVGRCTGNAARLE